MYKNLRLLYRMIIKKIPAGTRIYLTKDKTNNFYIQTGTTLLNDNLYVAYDVKIDGKIVIPKSTRVTGNWITQTVPEPAAQLQLDKIYLSGSGQNISADSDIITSVRHFKNARNSFMYKHKYRPSVSAYNNITHTIYKDSTSPEYINGSTYLEVNSKEISVILTQDFIPMPCFDS
ncbi:hypothetical protein QKC54_gp0684 [Megavirus baoshan]|uniref:Uncharacterized protein n=2 Tax=Megavirus baoshan TaxID=2496520 RepID=A0A8K1T0X3_9VIRU|nr:hypothetical protein QKC54_gp0684 [Megavirus baoshan]UFX99803.1 hypothetical protein Mb0388 [Megavirus baoshan]